MTDEYDFALRSLVAHANGLPDVVEDDAVVPSALLLLSARFMLQYLEDVDNARERMYQVVDDALRDAVDAERDKAKGDA